METSMKWIEKYFSGLDDIRKEQFSKLLPLYTAWNSKINVISRKDIDQLYLHHVLHSLAIAKVISFKKDTGILDIGTGGGFPGIPLAILFPQAHFTLVDSIAKKIKVVDAVIRELNLKNCETATARAENITGKFHFIVSRAVTTLPDFMLFTRGKILPRNFNELENGILYLKGGDIEEELKKINSYRIYPIGDFFEEDFFVTKKVVYIPANVI